MNKWTIIHTSDKNGNFLHEKHLKKYNPEAQIILADLSNNYAPAFAWFNCDLIFRDWLRNNIDKIENNNVYVCEYDVLTLTKVPELELNNTIYCSKKRLYDLHTWQWKDHILLLDEYKKYALAMIVFGWFLCSKNCLEIMLDPQFDKLYQKTIISELRFGTLLNYSGVHIMDFNNKYISPHKKNMPPLIEKPGFYHPAKKSVPLDAEFPIFYGNA